MLGNPIRIRAKILFFWVLEIQCKTEKKNLFLRKNINERIKKEHVRRGNFQDDQDINQRSRYRGYRRDFTLVCIKKRAEMQKKIEILMNM